MEKRVIDGIRKYYQLPDTVTNEQIEKKLKGSFGDIFVNFNLAKQDLIKAFGVPQKYLGRKRNK